MEILKRPSGGRGEYEIAGAHGSLLPADLAGHELVIELAGPYGNLPTGIELRIQGGKNRLRISSSSPHIHFHRQIEAVLLMPKSIRDEEQLVGGEPVLHENRYILRRIELRSVKRIGNQAYVALGRIDCDNKSRVEEIDVSARLSVIQRIHANAAQFPARIRDLLEAHQVIISSSEALKSAAEKLVTELIEALQDVSSDYNKVFVPGTDPLPFLRELVELPQMEKPPQIAAIDPQDIELRRREGARWRQYVTTRGAPAARFRRDVLTAYKATCLVCGLRLPKSDACRVPGVDAAHILPWSDYDLDVVGNGLCLCKLHHWAFDQLLIAILPEKGSSYRIHVTQIAIQALKDSPPALTYLRSCEGVIPKGRLPEDPAAWPRRQFLEKLYDDMEIKA